MKPLKTRVCTKFKQWNKVDQVKPLFFNLNRRTEEVVKLILASHYIWPHGLFFSRIKHFYQCNTIKSKLLEHTILNFDIFQRSYKFYIFKINIIILPERTHPPLNESRLYTESKFRNSDLIHSRLISWLLRINYPFLEV